MVVFIRRYYFNIALARNEIISVFFHCLEYVKFQKIVFGQPEYYLRPYG